MRMDLRSHIDSKDWSATPRIFYKLVPNVFLNASTLLHGLFECFAT